MASQPTKRAGPRLSRPPLRLDTLSRQELQDYFFNTWSLYEALFTTIREADSFYRSPDPMRHALVFYLGHTAAFYVNKLRASGAWSSGVNEPFEDLFATGIDPERPEDVPPVAWPPVAAVWGYRRQVFERLYSWIGGLHFAPPVRQADRELWSLLMALEHERIHLETSSVLLRQLPVHLLRRPAFWQHAPFSGGRRGAGTIAVPGATVVLGKPRDFPTFGWDNEYGKQVLEVGPFEAGADLVSNREFLEFVSDGGYARAELWCADGWRWRESSGSVHPKFWLPRDGDFGYRSTFDELDLPLDWPVEVNAHEARAYCRWRSDGWRLPTEGEFHRIAEGCPLHEADPIYTEGYNLDLAYGSPSAVGASGATQSARGFRDCYGNVWQWLAEDFRAFDGFEPDPLYPDYSKPFLDGRHSMLLGGSWASTGTSGSRFYRSWFRPHMHQHAGFRIARPTGRER